MITISDRLEQLPSKGTNIKWINVLAVNVDDRSQHEIRTLNKLVRTVRDRFMTTNIKHSEAFVAAAEKGRTVLDIKNQKNFVLQNNMILLKCRFSRCINNLSMKLKASQLGRRVNNE